MKKFVLVISVLFVFMGSALAENKVILGTCERAPYFASSLTDQGPFAPPVMGLA